MHWDAQEKEGDYHILWLKTSTLCRNVCKNVRIYLS